MAGLQYAYEVQVKDDIIEDLKRERDEVKRDLEDVAKGFEEERRTTAEAQEQATESYIREIKEVVEAAQEERASAVEQCARLQDELDELRKSTEKKLHDARRSTMFGGVRLREDGAKLDVFGTGRRRIRTMVTEVDGSKKL